MAENSLIGALEQVSKDLWETTLDDATFNALKARCSRLSAQIAVHHTLQKASSLILGSAPNVPLPNAQSRSCKFFDALYGNAESSATLELRWQRLRDLDCRAFFLIAVAYTPLDITKMNRTEFEYLVENATKYSETSSLPPDWIFRKEIQLAIVEKSDLPNIRLLKKRYHELEFSMDKWNYELPEKRFRREQHDEACPTPQSEHALVPEQAQQNDKSKNQSLIPEMPSDSFWSIPLIEAGAEVILQSVREGNGYQLNILLPKPNVPQPQPLMLIPLQICANIIKKYTG